MQDGIVGRQMEVLRKGNAGCKTAANVERYKSFQEECEGVFYRIIIIIFALWEK